MRESSLAVRRREPLPHPRPDLNAIWTRLDLFHQVGLGGTFEVDFDRELQRWTVTYTLVDRDPFVQNRTAAENSE